MLTSGAQGDILRFVVEAAPRQPQQLERNLKRFQKKLLTKSDRYVNINTCHGKQSFPRRKKISKKLLTNESGYDKISELPLRTTATNERALAKQEVMIFDK